VRETIFAPSEPAIRPTHSLWPKALALILLGAALTLVALRFLGPKPGTLEAPLQAAAQPSPDPIGEGRRNAIVRAAETAGPSVVSITAVETRTFRYSPYPYGFDELFSRFFGQIPGNLYQQEVPRFGSGFLFDERGYVLTNAHVVSGADKIQVTLPDGMHHEGRVLGSDADYDLAVVKIEGRNFPSVPIGNSDDLIVGEWAIAIGNPFGYLLGDSHPTVTVGVISATNRDIRADVGEGGVYKNMIQTDAAINPGNSGGPLVNSSGQVIGVNTFIFTQSGGSLGIGFAIPINTAIEVANDLIEVGHVRRAWIGITVVDLSPYLAARLGTEKLGGVVVYSIERNSPADRAGVKAGDIIRAVGGVPVPDKRAISRQLFGLRSGDSVDFFVERDGREKRITVRLESLPDRRQ
jgi:serine protease Do